MTGLWSSRWRDRPTHRAWLESNVRGLIDFYRPTLDAAGRFIELGDDGGPQYGPEEPQGLLCVARMTHSFALGEMLGIPGCAPIVRRGLQTMWEEHRDLHHGGYFASIHQGRPVDTTKAGYLHAFVVLAASTATIAGHDARELLDDALGVLDEHFWDEEAGAAREAFSVDWRELEAYRGANSNMHLTEAYLAAGDATGDDLYTRRAGRIAALVINEKARENGWMLPEHYDAAWTTMRGFNADKLDDAFRPYGVTIGHLLEWSRLLITLWTCEPAEAWRREAAVALFDTAVRVGWDDARPGLPYTVDFDGSRANADRYWWVVAEGISAAAALSQVVGDETYETWYRTFWDNASQYFVDVRRGSWYPELDEFNRPKSGPWYGKPDLYHVLQCNLLALYPLSASVAGALRS